MEASMNIFLIGLTALAVAMCGFALNNAHTPTTQSRVRMNYTFVGIVGAISFIVGALIG